MPVDKQNSAPPTAGLETLEPRMLLCATTAVTADLAGELDAWWRFDEPGVATVADDSGSASAHDGTLNGAANVSALGLCGGAGIFSGGEMNIANHNDINLGINAQRTIALWFNADDLDTPGRQIIYEEGGGTRGLNIYLENGQLVVGGWNRAESGWQGTWLSTDAVAAGQWHHVALTLNGTATVQPDALHAYLDGNLFASGEGSQLWSHSGDITIGGVGDTRFPDGSSGAAGFRGLIDDFRLYNRALSSHDINVLSGRYNEGAAITLATTWRNNLIPKQTSPEPAPHVDALETTQQAQSKTQSKADVAIASDVKAEPRTFAAPGVDEASPPQAPAAEPAPAETTAPAHPTPTADAPATAADENNADASSADVAIDADAATRDDPQVTEVPTDGKRDRVPHHNKNDTPHDTRPDQPHRLSRDD